MKYSECREDLLKEQIIEQNKLDDFEAFWQDRIAALREIPVSFERKKLDTPYEKSFLTYQVSFTTHDKTVVEALFSVPVGREGEKLPCVAYFHGGGGKKRLYHAVLATGVCCFAIDVRSQGGTTIDRAEYGIGDTMGSLMTRGITDKDRFYMKNIYLDAVRAMDVIARMPEVDPSRIVTFGQSQGGALSVVASAFSGLSRKCYVSEPSYCCLRRRVELGTGVFSATNDFLKRCPEYTDAVFETLTYFDINNIVSFLSVPADFCLALADPICLPEFVYSAYAHIDAPKRIHFFPFVPHHTPEAYDLFLHEEFSELSDETGVRTGS